MSNNRAIVDVLAKLLEIIRECKRRQSDFREHKMDAIADISGMIARNGVGDHLAPLFRKALQTQYELYRESLFAIIEVSESGHDQYERIVKQLIQLIENEPESDEHEDDAGDEWKYGQSDEADE